MRISAINVNNSNRNQNPSFGLKLVENPNLEAFVKLLKNNGASEAQVTDLFEQITTTIDDSKTLKFDFFKTKCTPDQTRILGEEIHATMSYDQFKEKVYLFIPRNTNYSEVKDLSSLKNPIMNTAHLLGEVAKDTKQAYSSVISKVFNPTK